MSEEVKEIGRQSARLTKISTGGRVWVTRKYPSAGIIRLQGYVEMRLYVNDRIRASEVTFADFEFFTGGVISFAKGAELEIVGINRAEQINMSFFDKIKSRNKHQDPLQIRTSSQGGLKG